MEYTIKQVSEMTKIPASKLRFYNKNGLLQFFEKNLQVTENFFNWNWQACKLLNV